MQLRRMCKTARKFFCPLVWKGDDALSQAALVITTRFCQWPMQFCSASWMNRRLRLYRNESFFSGLQMLRWSTFTSMRSPMPRSEQGDDARLELEQQNHSWVTCSIHATHHSSVTYLLTVLVQPEHWSLIQCLLEASPQSSAPWIHSF